MASAPKDQQDSADIKSRLKESYDTIATEYNEWTLRQTSLRIEYLEKLMEKLLTAKPLTGQMSLVLELGCGCGLPVTERLLTAPDTYVTANDLSTTQIDVARKNLAKHGTDRVSFAEGDMMKLEFSEGSFDAVIAMYSIIHLPREEQTEMINRVAKWLKPGGLLLANFASKDLPAVVNEKWLHEKGWMYWSGWGADATVEQLKEAGLEVIVKDIVDDKDDAEFLWVMAKK
ncbi:methyltransferase domain-containing protein [Colletotrichum godetiae]|uniref:Methyltransferase domain-containing protein n=1 Tax=Colletotrichum godetiae TaxID=1209918 RepID=A0AAJ0AKP5_9PEZI|nr:methyltransferase domain-containing protein [Colletotrichum godetiae]KAK1674188.1 methyltransferase domain-containing protein [Colletotrichum godetiae]